MTDDDVEMIAMTMMDACSTFYAMPCPPRSDNPIDCHRYIASAAIASLKAAGWRKIGPDEVVVPMWPDKAMIKSGSLVKHSAVEPPLNEAAAAEIIRLRAMVRDAYNDGFSQGMREHTTRDGGIPWSDCKYRAMIAAKNDE